MAVLKNPLDPPGNFIDANRKIPATRILRMLLHLGSYRESLRAAAELSDLLEGPSATQNPSGIGRG